MLVRALLAATLCTLPTLLGAQTFLFQIDNQNVPYDPLVGTASFQVSPTIEENGGSPGFPNDTQAFSMGISHDPTFLDALSVAETGVIASLNGGAGPDFFGANIFSNGVTVGCVYTFDMSQLVAYSSSEAVVDIDYDVDPGVLLGDIDGATTTLAFDDTLSTPPVLNVIIVDTIELSAQTLDGTITFDSIVSSFIRGDLDGNGTQNLGDAVIILVVMFAGGVATCDDALDTNDDGLLDLGDGVYLLEYLFTMGPPVPAPATICDLDLTADGLGCMDGPGCP